MKKFFILPLMALLIVFTACNRNSSTPEDTVKAFLETVKTGNYEGSAAYTEVPVFDQMPQEEKEILNTYFSSITYDAPKVITKTDNRATVAVDITGTDIFLVVQQFILNITQTAITEGISIDDMTDEQLDQMLTDALVSSDAPKKTASLELDLAQVGSGSSKKWVILVNDNLRAGLFLQDPDMEPDYGYGGEEGQYELVETITSSAKYIQGDDLAGICSFQVEDEFLHMYCDESQYDYLENLTNKETEITYQVLVSSANRNNPDINDTLYILVDIN